jgi:hypothetical protein
VLGALAIFFGSCDDLTILMTVPAFGTIARGARQIHSRRWME